MGIKNTELSFTSRLTVYLPIQIVLSDYVIISFFTFNINIINGKISTI